MAQQPKSGSPPKRRAQPGAKPGQAVLTRKADGRVEMEYDVSGLRAATTFEADLARAVLRSGTLEYQFVQVHPMSPDIATHVLSVRVSLESDKRSDPRWRELLDSCIAHDKGRSLEEVAAAFNRLDLSGAKVMSLRALFERHTRFARHATATFATVQGEELGKFMGSDPTTQINVSAQPVVEVTMDVAVMSELLVSIWALYGGHDE